MAWIGRRPPARLTEPDRVARPQPFDDHRLRAVEHDELHVLVRHLVQVLEERQRRLAQPVGARREHAELPQLEADPEPAVGATFEHALPGELRAEPVHGGEGQPGRRSELGEGLPAVGRVLEGAEERQRTPEDGPPCHGLLAHAPSDQPEYPAVTSRRQTIRDCCPCGQLLLLQRPQSSVRTADGR